MRVVYVDLHANTFFVRSLGYIINKQRAIDKHRFILDWLIQNHVQVIDFVTLDGSTMPGSVLRKMFRNVFFRTIEAKYVLKKNKLNHGIKIISDYEELQEEDIIIFYGHFPNVQFGFNPNTRGIKIGDYIHFYGDKETSEKMRTQNIVGYFAEINLEKYCGLYRKYYHWFKGEYIQRKFAFQDRFKVKKEFSKRKNKAVAMGTITRCDIPEFIEYYGSDIYQPLRKMIYDNKEYLSGELDSFISNYQEIPRKIINQQEPILKKIYKRAYNYLSNGKQTSYFSFDMVEKYNEYKMFVCPEDAIGQYGIGIIEGMACGCAMIGLNSGVYEDLGFVDGVHYISYDGSLENLKKKISFYQKQENQDELLKIAKNGCEFVRANFSQKSVAIAYYDCLCELVQNHRKRMNDENISEI